VAFEKAKRELAKLVEVYTGKSVDELLAITNGREIDFLWAIEIALQEKLERVGLDRLSEEERTVLAIQGLVREVNNGGYSQFFSTLLDSTLRSSRILC